MPQYFPEKEGSLEDNFYVLQKHCLKKTKKESSSGTAIFSR